MSSTSELENLIHEASWYLQSAKDCLTGDEPSEVREALSLASDAVSKLTEVALPRSPQNDSEDSIRSIEKSLSGLLDIMKGFDKRLSNIEKKKRPVVKKKNRELVPVPTPEIIGKK